MTTHTSTGELVGRTVVGIRGERLGKIDRLLVYGDGAEPNWARVKFGLFGRRGVLIPLEHAHLEGRRVRLVEERDYVRQAPRIDPDGDRISEHHAEMLHEHYGLERVTGLNAAGASDDIAIDLPRETRDAVPPAMEEGPDSPLAKRRRERAREFGVPEHH
jgi:hypothetical protein